MMTAAALQAVQTSQISVSVTTLVSFGLALLGLGITVVIALIQMSNKYGRLQGRLEEFKESAERRISNLEKADNHAITRDELDARFNEMRSAVSSVNDRFSDLIGLVRSWMEKQ